MTSVIEAIFSMPAYTTVIIVLIGYLATCFGIGILFLKIFDVRLDLLEQISAGTILATAFILGQGLFALGGRLSIHVVGTFCIIFTVLGLEEQLELDHLPKWLSLEPKYNETSLSVYKIKFNNPPLTV
jgi:hypothetical protein